jgi:hypothetical protein
MQLLKASLPRWPRGASVPNLASDADAGYVCAAQKFADRRGHRWPVRQVEAYDNGPALRYGPGHEEDRYGGLGQVSLDDLKKTGARSS